MTPNMKQDVITITIDINHVSWCFVYIKPSEVLIIYHSMWYKKHMPIDIIWVLSGSVITCQAQVSQLHVSRDCVKSYIVTCLTSVDKLSTSYIHMV